MTSGRLDRVAGVPGGMEIPIGAAADRWAKSAGRVAAKVARYHSVDVVHWRLD